MSYVNLISADVSSTPSCHKTPFLSLKVMVLPSLDTVGKASATSGDRFKFLSYFKSDEYIKSQISLDAVSECIKGTKHKGSLKSARIKIP
ncbi:hypothetical protein SDC9_190101 [bioreactor metagenome]|uniref:Uncharacterized protein n=1 Tax=bioreactor metagenome TaxID=1076179 RepID=A0A645I250_9ZZZZ